VNIGVTLIGGAQIEFPHVKADRFLDLDLKAGTVSTVVAPK
jgi:hypothetical protein